jgi:hypothetical protein
MAPTRSIKFLSFKEKCLFKSLPNKHVSQTMRNFNVKSQNWEALAHLWNVKWFPASQVLVILFSFQFQLFMNVISGVEIQQGDQCQENMQDFFKGEQNF